MLTSIKRSSTLFSVHRRSSSPVSTESTSTSPRRSLSEDEAARHSLTSGSLSASTSISSGHSDWYRVNPGTLKGVNGAVQVVELYYSKPNGWYLRAAVKVINFQGDLESTTISIPVRKTKGRRGNQQVIWDLTPYLDEAYPGWTESVKERKRIAREHVVSGLLYQEYRPRKESGLGRAQPQVPRQAVAFVLNRKESKRVNIAQRWLKRMSSSGSA